MREEWEEGCYVCKGWGDLKFLMSQSRSKDHEATLLKSFMVLFPNCTEKYLS